ncbi:hypothetical protein COLO4_20332 [Corchorus olitorius]|uniref:Uncharacterized protein n=1 Tax=Corchorus olitorius TaxID=93759 RepID=A0A1R3J0C5_9ROSI|nr:hypothetical protein COLO4_20332 [Corchorus olitorius]
MAEIFEGRGKKANVIAFPIKPGFVKEEEGSATYLPSTEN